MDMILQGAKFRLSWSMQWISWKGIARASLQELLEKNSFDPAERVMRNRRLVHSSERSKVQTRAVS